MSDLNGKYYSIIEECLKEDFEVIESANKGIKYDTDKLRYDLLPLDVVQDVVSVLTSGAIKYSPYNWKYVDNAQNRYYNACMRHLTQSRLGETIDTDSGKSHLIHAICNLIFLAWFEKQSK